MSMFRPVSRGRSGLASRQPEPLALTWEPLALAVLGWGLATIHALTAARVVAAWMAGQGWAWPTQPGAVVLGMATGNLSAGFGPGPTPPVVLVAGLALIGQFVIALAFVGLRALVRPVLGLGGRTGLATPTQLRRGLGVHALRAVRHQVRPDLYPKGPDDHHHHDHQHDEPRRPMQEGPAGPARPDAPG